jgi:amino acid transporter
MSHGQRSERAAEPITDGDSIRSFGYRDQFPRVIRSLTSVAIGIAATSVTVAAFSLFSFVLTTSAPRGLLLWPVACAGQILIALVAAQLAAHYPLTGFTYQPASRLTHPLIGWMMGWLYAVLFILAFVAADFGIATQVIIPLFNLSYSLGLAETIAIIAMVIETLIALLSVRLMSWFNNVAVATEIIGGLGLAILIAIVAAAKHNAHVSNFYSLGPVSSSGYYSFLGPFMLGILLGVYVISTFEAPTNFAEETVTARRNVPKAIVRTVIYSTIAGFIVFFLFLISVPNLDSVAKSSAPLSDIMAINLGSAWEHVFLVMILISYISLGLLGPSIGGRIIFGMARDRRFPGYQVLTRVPARLGTPAYAIGFAGLAAIIILLLFAGAPTTFNNLLSSTALIIEIIYVITVAVFLLRHSKLPAAAGFSLGKAWMPVGILALVWAVFAVIVLSAPSAFHLGAEWAGYLILVGVAVGLAMTLYRPKEMLSIRNPAALPEAPSGDDSPERAGLEG